MRIGLDVDSCLRNQHDKLCRVYSRVMGTKEHWCTNYKMWSEWNVAQYFSIGDLIWDFWFITHAKEIYLDALPYNDIDDLKKLTGLGHDLIIISSQPNSDCMKYTIDWVDRYVEYKEMHFTGDKHLVKCDVYLDDSPENMEKIKTVDAIPVLMDAPYNQKVDGVHRVFGLSQFIELVGDMS